MVGRKAFIALGGKMLDQLEEKFAGLAYSTLGRDEQSNESSICASHDEVRSDGICLGSNPAACPA
jgi:hypothetical protein